MKNRWLPIVAAALLALATAFALSRVAMKLCATTAPVDRLNDTAWLTQTLGLNADQAAKIAALQGEFTKKVNDGCATHCAARYELGQMLARPDPKPEEAEARIDLMAQAQRDNDVATLRHLMDLRAVLTPEQWARLSGLLQKQFCGPCPMAQHDGSSL